MGWTGARDQTSSLVRGSLLAESPQYNLVIEAARTKRWYCKFNVKAKYRGEHNSGTAFQVSISVWQLMNRRILNLLPQAPLQLGVNNGARGNTHF
jgi:hypothetical protein